MNQQDLHLKKNSHVSVLSYSNVTDYLNAYYDHRKRKDPSFSYELWGLELGENKGKTLLRLICKGERNMTSDLAESFVKKNNLSATESKHLHLISLYKKSQSTTEKDIFYDKLLENLDHKEFIIENEENVSFLSKKELPLLQVLLAFPDLNRSVENLAMLMQLPANQVQDLLENLEDLGMAESNEHKQWAAVTKKFKVADKKDDQDLVKLYQQTADESKIAVEQKDTLKRFRSLFLSMNENSFGEFCEDLEQFINKSRNKYGASTISENSIFKINFNAYTVTEKSSKK